MHRVAVALLAVSVASGLALGRPRAGPKASTDFPPLPPPGSHTEFTVLATELPSVVAMMADPETDRLFYTTGASYDGVYCVTRQATGAYTTEPWVSDFDRAWGMVRDPARAGGFYLAGQRGDEAGVYWVLTGQREMAALVATMQLLPGAVLFDAAARDLYTVSAGVFASAYGNVVSRVDPSSGLVDTVYECAACDFGQAALDPVVRLLYVLEDLHNALYVFDVSSPPALPRLRQNLPLAAGYPGLVLAGNGSVAIASDVQGSRLLAFPVATPSAAAVLVANASALLQPYALAWGDAQSVAFPGSALFVGEWRDDVPSGSRIVRVDFA
jgi:hypothetical protein